MYKTTERNCLCENCNRNQEIILNKLSNYEAKTVSTNDLEIEMYRGYLDKLYDLCGDCKSKVKFEIRKQDGILKQYLYKIGNFEYFFENNNKMSKRIRGSGGAKNNEFEVKKEGKGRDFYLNIILLLMTIYFLIHDYFQFNSFYLNLFFYIISYTISFFILFFNNFEYKHILVSILIIISMYRYYLNFNSCFFINFSIFLNIFAHLTILKGKAKEKKAGNEDLKKYFNIKDQSKLFINSLNGSSSCGGVGSHSIIKPAIFNFTNKFESNSDSDFEDDYGVEDNNSSICSGMTNLYLEKTRSVIKSKINSNIKIQPKKLNCQSPPQKFNNNNNNIYAKGKLVLFLNF